jgi:hypothetical protein
MVGPERQTRQGAIAGHASFSELAVCSRCEGAGWRAAEGEHAGRSTSRRLRLNRFGIDVGADHASGGALAGVLNVNPMVISVVRIARFLSPTDALRIRTLRPSCTGY